MFPGPTTPSLRRRKAYDSVRKKFCIIFSLRFLHTRNQSEQPKCVAMDLQEISDRQISLSCITRSEWSHTRRGFITTAFQLRFKILRVRSQEGPSKPRMTETEWDASALAYARTEQIFQSPISHLKTLRHNTRVA